MKMKRRLNEEQEFRILLLVLDKVLWFGFGIMALGFYKMLSSGVIGEGIYFLIAGIVILTIFVWQLIKEYHFSR